MYTIIFSNVPGGNPIRKIMDVEDGYSLLELAFREEIAIRHDCGGICRCSTCRVEVDAGLMFLSPVQRREMDFLQRIPDRTTVTRLACQCLLQPGAGEVWISLPTTNKM